MNKFMKVLAASALIATALVGCGKKDEGTSGGASTAAKFAKAGLGVSSTFDEKTGQVNSTYAAIGLDKDGKVQYIDIDVAQSTPGDKAKAITQSKQDLKEKYGMKEASKAAGKIKDGGEWYEQAAAFEDFCKGKTPAQIAAIEVEDFHGGKAAKTGTDLASKCTITINEFLDAIAKANTNAQDAAAESIKLGYNMSNDAEEKQLNTTIALIATDKDGKVVYSKIDVAQIYKGVTDTKGELKEKYGMKETSAKAGKIKDGGEWYEQAAAFEAAIKGKTVADIANIEVEDYHGGKAPKAGTDLASKCTITIDAFLAAIAAAR